MKFLSAVAAFLAGVSEACMVDGSYSCHCLPHEFYGKQREAYMLYYSLMKSHGYDIADAYAPAKTVAQSRYAYAEYIPGENPYLTRWKAADSDPAWLAPKDAWRLNQHAVEVADEYVTKVEEEQHVVVEVTDAENYPKAPITFADRVALLRSTTSAKKPELVIGDYIKTEATKEAEALAAKRAAHAAKMAQYLPKAPEPEPVYEEPMPEPVPEPVYEEPVYAEPEPVYEEPVVYEEPEPVYEEPVYEEPEPVYEEPAYEEPAYGGHGHPHYGAGPYGGHGGHGRGYGHNPYNGGYGAPHFVDNGYGLQYGAAPYGGHGYGAPGYGGHGYGAPHGGYQNSNPYGQPGGAYAQYKRHPYAADAPYGSQPHEYGGQIANPVYELIRAKTALPEPPAAPEAAE